MKDASSDGGASQELINKLKSDNSRLNGELSDMRRNMEMNE